MPEAGNHEREREDIVDHDGGIPAYGKIHALGSRFVEDIFKQGKVIVQEKVDGSQFSFAKLNGRLRIRSKGREIFQEAPDSLFKPGVEYVQSIEAALVPGWIYRAEYLRVPKHNALTYSRIPRNHIALFDVLVDRETYLDHAGIVEQADILRVEAVPELCVFTGHIEASTFLELLKTESFWEGKPLKGLWSKTTTCTVHKRVIVLWLSMCLKLLRKSIAVSGAMQTLLEKMWFNVLLRHTELRQDGKKLSTVLGMRENLKERQEILEALSRAFGRISLKNAKKT